MGTEGVAREGGMTDWRGVDEILDKRGGLA